MHLMAAKAFTFSLKFKAYFSLSLKCLTNLLFHKGCQFSVPDLEQVPYGGAVVHSSQMKEIKFLLEFLDLQRQSDIFKC